MVINNGVCKMKKKIAAAALLLCLLFTTAYATVITENGTIYCFPYNEDECYLYTCGETNGDHLIIPERVTLQVISGPSERTITKVGMAGFMGTRNVNRATLPATIREIEKYLCYGSDITEITFLGKTPPVFHPEWAQRAGKGLEVLYVPHSAMDAYRAALQDSNMDHLVHCIEHRSTHLGDSIPATGDDARLGTAMLLLVIGAAGMAAAKKKRAGSC